MSEPDDWIGSKNEGYIVNAGFSSGNTEIIMRLIQYLSGFFGDALSFQKEESLHITLLDWIAPLHDYDGKDKADLYENIKSHFDKEQTKILAGFQSIKVQFNEIEVHPSTIILRGYDDGSFQKIRNEFVASVDLLPGTKLPPNIVHASLARFTKAVPIDEVKKVLEDYKINFTEKVSCFRLMNSHTVPLSEPDILKNYKLKN